MSNVPSPDALADISALLHDEERNRAEDLAAINELGGLIAQHIELPALLGAAVQKLSRIASVPNVFVTLVEGSGEWMKVAATNLEHPAALGVRISLAEPSVAGDALRLRCPVVIHDAKADPRASKRLVELFGHRALLALPLVADGKSIGALVLGDTRETRRFGKPEVDRAVACANQLAIAIAKAQLYADLKRSYDELARAQDKLVHHERLAALGELAAVMAHEVRNPLGVIFNSLGSLRKILRPEGDAELLLSILEEEAERLNRIVGKLLDFARPYEARVRPTNLALVVAGAVEAARKAVPAGEVEILTEVPPMPGFAADADLLRQALVNLITNAIQAASGSGRVVVRAKAEAWGGRRAARLDVIDEGAGIAPAHLSRIFLPFFTTKASGTGLGLAVVKRIVDAHHGDIEVESAGGKTTFSLKLPWV